MRIYLTDSTFQISCQNFFLACGKARSWVIGGFLLIFADFFSFSSIFLDIGLHIPFQGLKTIKSNEVQQFQVFSAVNMKFLLLSYPKKAEKWPKIDILAFSRLITGILRSATGKICVFRVTRPTGAFLSPKCRPHTFYFVDKRVFRL